MEWAIRYSTTGRELRAKNSYMHSAIKKEDGETKLIYKDYAHVKVFEIEQVHPEKMSKLIIFKNESETFN